MKYSGLINRFSAMLVAIISITAQQKAPLAAECPCDIYTTGGTPCVAAYSTVRLLSSSYTGPLYQVRRTSDNQTKDIGTLTGGTVANAAAQDSFLGTGAGTISKLYDQSGKGNDLIRAPGGSANSTQDKESNAKGKSFKINGHNAYALYTNAGEGYRNNAAKGMPTGNQPQGIYAVEDGSRPNQGCCCCFDFGNAETNNNADGTGSMNSLYFGNGYWEKGSGGGSGPWFLNDMEAGVWAGGSTACCVNNNNLPPSKFDFAFGLTKTSTTTSGQYAIRVANATAIPNTNVNLVTAYDGQAPTNWHMGGAIILGIGGDNSNTSFGTFYEGCITYGRPTDKTDTLILKNVQAAGYGSTTTSAISGTKEAAPMPLFKVRYNPSSASAAISYILQDARHVSMNVFNQEGRQVAVLIDALISTGRHETVWDAKNVPAGTYVCRATIEGTGGWTEKIVIQK